VNAISDSKLKVGVEPATINSRLPGSNQITQCNIISNHGVDVDEESRGWHALPWRSDRCKL